MNPILSIGELARLSGLSTYTLRFYEAEGLLSAVRAANGHRRYHTEEVRWLEFVMRLKNTGMPLAQIKQYAQLRAEGDQTLAERLAMLQQHRQSLHQQIQELNLSANALDAKITFYQDGIEQQTQLALTKGKNEITTKQPKRKI